MVLSGCTVGDLISAPYVPRTGTVLQFGSDDDDEVVLGISGELDIPPARLTCVVPAFQEAVTLLADTGTEFTASLALQADLGASLLSPM